MENNESASEFYHRVFKLWQKAKTPTDERIEQFLATLKPGTAHTLMNGKYTEIRPLTRLENLKTDKKKTPAATLVRTACRHPRIQVAQAPPRGQASSSTSSKPNESNSKLGPVATKLVGWIGTWHKLELNLKKLEDKDRDTLTRQGRCWACRGSGHRGSDKFCPKREA